MAKISKYDPDEPRDEGGKWTSGGGGYAGDARIDESLRDPKFMAEHGARLHQIDAESRANFGPHASPQFVDQAATAAVRSHVESIHADADAKSRGFENAAAEHAHFAALRAEREAAADREMHAAIAAGHVSPEATKIADEYTAAADARNAQHTAHAEALDHAHHEALNALDDLHAMQHEGNESEKELEFQHTHLHDEFGETQQTLDSSHGGYGDSDHVPREAPEFPGNIEDREDRVAHPDEGDHEEGSPEYERQLQEHDAWQAKAQSDYDAAKSSHAAELKSRADTAQSALERLHEHQTAHIAALNEMSKTSNGAQEAALSKFDDMEPDHSVNHEAFAHHERDYGENDDGSKITGADVEDEDKYDPEFLADKQAQEDYRRAYSASERAQDKARAQIEERDTPDYKDQIASLKEEQKATAKAIKEVSKYSGRASTVLPAKPAGKTKKSLADWYWEAQAVSMLAALRAHLA
ncbi:MAG TPA: hypothetical protein VFQ42_22380 [Mycobacterium sp.]|nr:hypothetical protein [Mycobacterium sp.]